MTSTPYGPPDQRPPDHPAPDPALAGYPPPIPQYLPAPMAPVPVPAGGAGQDECAAGRASALSPDAARSAAALVAAARRAPADRAVGAGADVRRDHSGRAAGGDPGRPRSGRLPRGSHGSRQSRTSRLPLPEPRARCPDPDGRAVHLGRSSDPAPLSLVGGRRSALEVAASLPAGHAARLAALHRTGLPGRAATGIGAARSLGAAADPGGGPDAVPVRRRGVPLPRLDHAEHRLLLRPATRRTDRLAHGVHGRFLRRPPEPRSVDLRHPRLPRGRLGHCGLAHRRTWRPES